MFKSKRFVFTAGVIALTILALLQLAYIVLSARPKEKTDFDIYLETQSQPVYSIKIEPFSLFVPQEWADSWTDSGSVAEDMKNYYLNTDGSSEYSYKDKIICVKGEDSIQILKRGEFYVNMKVVDVTDRQISYSDIFSSEYLSSMGLDMEGIEVCEFRGGLQPGGNNIPAYSVYAIINRNLHSLKENGYMVVQRSEDGSKLALLTVSMSDGYEAKHPGQDSIIAESLTESLP